MKVYISGGSGLVGSNVIERAPENIEILAPTHGELDLLDFNKLKSFLEREKPDFIIHTAGKVGGIKANQDDMFGFLTENAIIGLNLIKAAKEAGIKNLINLSTCCAYPVECQNPLKEEYLTTGKLDKDCEGYAIAKNSIVKACDFAREKYGINYKSIIPVNLYGRYDKFDVEKSHFVPAVIRKLYEAMKNGDESVEIWGSGNVRRELFYAGELADFIWYCVDNIDNMPELINCSNGEDFSINEIYQKIANIVGYKGRFHHNLNRPEGISAKLTDNTKMKEFGWETKTSFEEGISQSFEFYKNKVENE